jgi:hypothetical protein
MKHALLIALLAVAGWAQDTVVIVPQQGIPAPDIAKEAGQIAATPARAQEQAARTKLLQQQAALMKAQADALKQQTEALKQQNALAAQTPKQFIPAVRKPRIDDVDALTGKPRFATYADYEDAKDEWLIEEAMRRFEALHPTTKQAAK